MKRRKILISLALAIFSGALAGYSALRYLGERPAALVASEPLDEGAPVVIAANDLEVGSIAPGNVFAYDATALVRGNARLVGTSNYSPWALAEALAFLRRNHRRYPFARLVSHVFPLARIGDAFREADWMQRGGDELRLSRAALAMDGGGADDGS